MCVLDLCVSAVSRETYEEGIINSFNCGIARLITVQFVSSFLQLRIHNKFVPLCGKAPFCV